MKALGARFITYSVVGGLAFLAMRATPPLPPAIAGDEPEASAVADLTDRLMGPSEMPAEQMKLDPVMVVASNRNRIDTLALTGVINSSLYSSLDQVASAHLPRAARAGLAWTLADIFEYRVDMSRDLQQGDRFNILVERMQQPNGKILINKIIGAKLALSGNEIEAIHFQSAGASGEYFDGNGKSLRAAFLRTPVSFRRISSMFGRRYHPVLGRWRQHKGTDYAASSGTPVRSIGDGVVIFAGRKGGYGNVIDIKHRNGYVSRYGHLRNFSAGIQRGARVQIGRTIGSVGMTGLATGPHLHFELLVGGIQRDPRMALRMKGGDPIPSSERRVFQRLRQNTLATLDSYRVSGLQ